MTKSKTDLLREIYTPKLNPWNITTYEELESLTKSSNVIYDSVAIRGQYIRILERLEKVVGDFGTVDSVLESFGSLKEVTCNIFISVHHMYPALSEDLGNLEVIGGNAYLRDLPDLLSLGGLRRVEGNLSLRNTTITDLGQLEFVGGNVSLSKRMEGKIDFSKVQIVGKIKYFNDLTSRLDNIKKPKSNLAKSELEVPYWRHMYAVSSDMLLISATEEQKNFYEYFKENFVKGKFLDLLGNTNYVFLLMFEYIKQLQSISGFRIVKKTINENRRGLSDNRKIHSKFYRCGNCWRT